ncbi:hypothetical protein A9168_10475 [Macellibacteroides sp. HH-ZS]|jgi:transmembrane sensor|nr:hypothetical protein A9168_10475 [Macellibacteroides sp. HH-ZS]
MHKQNPNRNSINELFVQQLEKRLSSYKLYERNKYSEGEEEVWIKIQKEIKANKKAKVKRLVYLVISSAACLLLLVGIANHLVPFTGLFNEEMSLAEVPIPDVASDSIMLYTSTDVFLNVEDHSSITYNSEGSVLVKSKTITHIDHKKEAKGKLYNQIIVPPGKRTNVAFADGTKICVNAGTRVVYPEVFSNDSREIYVEGEIYLEVFRDESRPFIVRTEKMNVRVLGTTFNISAYKNQAESSVVLVEGKVEVESINKQKISVSPNEMVLLNGGEMSKKLVDVYDYISWKDNLLKLDAEPLHKVLNKLSNYYGRKIVFDNTLASIPISGKLDLRDNLEDVISILAETAPILITNKDDTIIVRKK